MTVGSRIRQFVVEVRRRRVLQTAALYTVGAWAVIQVGDLVFEAWGFGDAALRWLFVGAALGFPIAIVFGWRYDITKDGIIRTAPSSGEAVTDLSLHRSDYVVLAALVVITAVLIWVIAGKAFKQAADHEQLQADLGVAPNSIAVLPFRNLSPDSSSDYVSDGLAYELSSYLSRRPELMVTASSSTFALKNRDLDAREVRRLLRVQYVVEGALRTTGGRFRVDVQLVDTNTGFRIWHETLELDAADMLERQAEVAGEVVAEMQSTLGVDVPDAPESRMSANPAAYEAYLLGMHEVRTKIDHQKRGDWVERAIGHFEQAIEADPDFALAYARLARTHLYFLWSLRSATFDESMATARRLVERALVLDPDLDLAFTTLAQVYLNENDFEAREQALRRALEISPGNTDALFTLGRHLWSSFQLREARDVIRAAAIRDPLGMNTILLNADLDAKSGDYESAKQQLLRLVEQHPGAEPYDALAQLEEDFGHLDEAARWAHLGSDRSETDVDLATSLRAYDIAESWLPPTHAPAIGESIIARAILLIATDRPGEAVRYMNEAINAEVPASGAALEPRHVFLLNFGAFIMSAAGENEKAIEYASRGGQEHLTTLPVHVQIAGLSSLASAADEIGRRDEARRYLESAAARVREIEEFGSMGYPRYAFSRATYYAARGDDGRALALLEDAVDQGYRGYGQLRAYSALHKYKDEPRFKELLARIDADIAKQRARAIENGWIYPAPEVRGDGSDY